MVYYKKEFLFSGMVYYKKEFITAYIMTLKDNDVYAWEPWDHPDAKTIYREDVLTVCKSETCDNTNGNSYMSSNWNSKNKIMN